jgi:hypothetical protein
VDQGAELLLDGRNAKVRTCPKPVLRIRDVYPGSRIPNPDFYSSRISDPGSQGAELLLDGRNAKVRTYPKLFPMYGAG